MRLRHLVTFVLIATAQFGIFEVGLRTWGSSEAAPSFQGLFETDAAIGYRLKPHARTRFTTSEFSAEIAINGAGLRDDEEIGPKSRDERRIVLLGDSLVLSVQVPFRETFGELLEQRLNSRGSALRYRVINAGVQGYGPIEEQLFFRSIVGSVQPDLVLPVVFVGNDAEEAVGSQQKLDPNRRSSQAVVDSLLTRMRRLVRRSMVLQILRLRALAVIDRLSPSVAPPEPPLQSYAARPAPRIADGLTITRRSMQDIEQTASAAGAKAAVVLMPARFQVDDADYGRLKEIVAGTGGNLVRDAASTRFQEALAPLGMPMVDLLPALRAALPGPDLFYQETVHLTPRGHTVVAAALDRFIEEQRLLPR
jgi:SGNH hydrolase-like domain, acetyltransferase AlgX